MKRIFLITLTLITINSYADQLAVLSKEQAQKTLQFLKQNNISEAILWCACCTNDPKTKISLSNITIKNAGTPEEYYVVFEGRLNNGQQYNKYVDLAYVYIQSGNLAKCLCQILNFKCDPCTIPFAWIENNQSLQNQITTQEEYNYITKGYKVQTESGLDMKQGYSLIRLGEWSLTSGVENRECVFQGLLRDGQTKPCAIMMIYHRTDIPNGQTWYICIPTPNAKYLWQQTLEFISQNFKGNDLMLQSVIWALMKFSSEIATK